MTGGTQVNGNEVKFVTNYTNCDGQNRYMSEFKLHDWTGWIERFDHYVEINSVSENSKKSLFITSLSLEAYELLRNLYAPSSPSTKLFTDLVKIMKDHLKPASSTITERISTVR